MAKQEDIEKAVKESCSKIRKRVKKARERKKAKRYNVQDYPAVTVASAYVKSFEIVVGESKNPCWHKFNYILYNKLLELGPIGAKVNGNIVGACAEPHAADEVMKKHRACGISDLQFSKAYRPRTCQHIKYCKNCKDTFGL